MALRQVESSNAVDERTSITAHAGHEAQGPLSGRAIFYFDLNALIRRTALAERIERTRHMASRQLQAMLRREDFVLWSGSGFFLVINTPDYDKATIVAERIQQQIVHHLLGTHWTARFHTPRIARRATDKDLGELRKLLRVPAPSAQIAPRPPAPSMDTGSLLAGDEARDLAVLAHAERAAAAFKLDLAFVPIWDLRKRCANTLFCTLTGATDLSSRYGHDALIGASFAQIADIEIELLRAAAAYARRIRRHGQWACTGTAVGYQTLAVPASRARFLHELAGNDPGPFTKLVLTIDQIPLNAPAQSIAEMVSDLALPSVVPLIQLPTARILDRIPQPVGAAGYGLALRGDEGGDLTRMIAEIMTRFANDRGAFTWLSHLDAPAMMEAASDAGVRFATGAAIKSEAFKALGDVPALPLKAVELTPPLRSRT